MLRLTLERFQTGNKRYIEGSCLSTDVMPTEGICGGSILWVVDLKGPAMFNEAAGEWVQQFGEE